MWAPGPGGQGAEPLQAGRDVLRDWPALPRGLPHLPRPPDAEHQEAGLPPPPVQAAPGQGERGRWAPRQRQQRQHRHL